MLNLRQYARENPIAFRLLGLIVVSSSLITLFAILLQLYSNFHDDVSSLEKRLDQVRISTLAVLTKGFGGLIKSSTTPVDATGVTRPANGVRSSPRTP